MTAVTTEIALRAWSAGDFGLMERLLGDPRMTEHLGGPESPDNLRKRLESYLGTDGTDSGAMFVVVAGSERVAAGSVGYWIREWHGVTVWETGWSVLPEFQGQGIATRATRLVVEAARGEGRNRAIHAFPSVDNGPSNRVCQNAGFTLAGAHEFEYPKGHFMRCNDWVLDVPLPGDIGRPATAALWAEGLTHLEQLATFRAADLLRLHGVGGAGVERLRRALQAQGLGFVGEGADDDPEGHPAAAP